MLCYWKYQTVNLRSFIIWKSASLEININCKNENRNYFDETIVININVKIHLYYSVPVTMALAAMPKSWELRRNYYPVLYFNSNLKINLSLTVIFQLLCFEKLPFKKDIKLFKIFFQRHKKKPSLLYVSGYCRKYGHRSDLFYLLLNTYKIAVISRVSQVLVHHYYVLI